MCPKNLWSTSVMKGPGVNTVGYSWLQLATVGVTLVTSLCSAPEPSLQHYEGEEPRHGGRREEEVCYEASSGGASGNQENLLRQLHRHLQTVSLSPLVHTDLPHSHCRSHFTSMLLWSFTETISADPWLVSDPLSSWCCYLQTDSSCISSQVASST